MKKQLFVTSLVSLMGLVAQANPVFNPQSIIVNPIPTSLQVQTWVNKDPSGYSNSTYYIGENITLYVRVNQDAYVYLFDINANGRIDLVQPNAYSGASFMQAGETRAFPAQGARYQFTVDGPVGTDQVLAVASRQQLSLSQMADIRSGQMRVQGAGNLARALSIVVTPLPDQDWVSDTVSYRVAAQYGNYPQPQPVYPAPQPVYQAPQPPVVIVVNPIPGWAVVGEDRNGSDYSVIYQAGPVQDVYGYYDRDLIAKGWVRVNYNVRGNRNRPEYWAEYRRGGERAQLRIRLEKGQVRVNLGWNQPHSDNQNYDNNQHGEH
ncbi:MAG: DUF4384 domain-containing protein [Thermaceae bacterium]|nr:DUF4384 domain-containing protein [Thermaceae bacterium]